MHLAQIELLILFILLLCLLLLDTPVPRLCALPVALLLTVDTVALEAMEQQPVTLAGQPRPGWTLAEVTGALLVPAASAAVLVVVLGYLARAYAGLRRPSAGSSPPVGAPPRERGPA